MPDIFINYRTGDAEQTAAAIDADLVHRFGADRVFYAGRSIKPARQFDTEILAAVRQSRVLIVLIGPRWLSPDGEGRVRLLEEGDWVRREISEALHHGVHVLPVLVGRHTERVEVKALPPDVQGLALRQTKRYDHRESGAFMASLAQAVADLIPGLVDQSVPTRADSAAEQPGGRPRVSNRISGSATVHGPVIQAGDGNLRYATNEHSLNVTHSTTNTGQFAGVGTISGELSGTFINESNGPVSTGNGDIHVSGASLPTEQQPE